MLNPTDKQWWAMCDAHMSRPVSLRSADVSCPFVYDREYGLFYVPMGYHQQAMALLLAFKHDLTKAYELADKLKINFDPIPKLADQWLADHPGTCFKSSVSKAIQCWKPGHLSVSELRLLGDVQYLAPATPTDDVAMPSMAP